MALPALAAVRVALPETKITIAAISTVAPVFDEETPAAPDAVLTIPDRRQETAILANGKFDAALLLTNSLRSAWTTRRAGIPDRWGYAANLRGALLTKPVSRPRERLHQSTYYTTLVANLGFEVVESLPRVAVRPDTARRADELLGKHGVSPSTRLIGFAPGAAGGHAKRWAPSRVADVISRVSTTLGAVSVILGAAGDREAGRYGCRKSDRTNRSAPAGRDSGTMRRVRIQRFRSDAPGGGRRSAGDRDLRTDGRASHGAARRS
jgi:heptosyltransferase II